MNDMSMLLGRVKFESESSSVWSGSNVVAIPTVNRRLPKQRSVSGGDRTKSVLHPLDDLGRQGIRVLLIARNVHELEVYKHAVKAVNCRNVEVMEALNGVEGMILADRQRPDCIVLDVDLLDADNIDVLEQFVGLPYGKTILAMCSVEEEVSARSMFRESRIFQWLLKDEGGCYLAYLPAMVTQIWECIRREREKKEIEALFYGFIDHLPGIAYVSPLQTDSRLLYVSPQIESLGYNRELWLSNPSFRFQCIEKEDRASVERAFVRSCESGEKFHCEYRVRNNIGQLRWFSDKGAVVKNALSGTVFFQGIMKDITDLKAMENELEEHRYFLEQRVGVRTEQLEKRIAILESCNAELCNQLEKERMHSRSLKGGERSASS